MISYYDVWKGRKKIASSHRDIDPLLYCGPILIPLCLFCFCCGCGTTREQQATNQLLLSDAIDRSVSHLDFSPLEGEKVFLDTSFIPKSSATSKFNSEYIISSIRQQMVLARCFLQESKNDADYIVEARIGAIGQDAHDVNYGIPGNTTLNTAASLVSSTPPLPSFPEVSIARRTEDSAVAKIAVFAYHRESKRPVWQSGLSVARSSSRNKWILGAGPFQSGEIHNGGTRFAGQTLNTRLFMKQHPIIHEEEQAYRNAAVFDEGIQKKLREKLYAATGENDALVQNDVQSESHEPESVNPAESKSDVELATHEENATPATITENKKADPGT